MATTTTGTDAETPDTATGADAGADGSGGEVAMALRPVRRGRTVLVSVAVVGVVLGLFVVALAGRKSSAGRSADSPLLGRPAPVTTGESLLDGEAFDLGDQGGRYVLVNFFATWCVPCVKEHDDLVAFSNRHRVGDDARVLSVVFDDRPDDIRSYFAAQGGDWPVIEDPDLRLALDWGVQGVPESYLVDPAGVVRARIVGGVTAEGLEELLARLKDPAPPPAEATG